MGAPLSARRAALPRSSRQPPTPPPPHAPPPRLCSFNLGEGIEVAKADLAADVEQQTKSMQEAAAKREAEAEPKAEEEAAPKEEAKAAVAISGASVRRAREGGGLGAGEAARAAG